MAHSAVRHRESGSGSGIGSPEYVRIQALPTSIYAQIASAVPTVRLDMYTCKPAQTFSFEGDGFEPNEPVDLFLGSHAAGIAIPLIPAGDYSLTLNGRASQTPASLGFNVQGIHPWVVLDDFPAQFCKSGETGAGVKDA